MSTKIKNVFTPAAWIFYLIIVFEIIYMISPFGIYYYSTYGPSLNFLHNWPQTAWLSGFILPHIVETSSWILNNLNDIGWILFLMGFLFFLIGAGQIYYNKFTKRGAVIGGIYKVIRNPQYVAFSVMGFGLLLVWPRFMALIMFVIMLFVYFFLSKKEEKECEKKYGESYLDYKYGTSMFFPGDISIFKKLPSFPKAGVKRFVAISLLFIVVLTFSVGFAFAVRNYSINKVSTFYSNDSATISVVVMGKDEIAELMQIALKKPEVESRLSQSGIGKVGSFLNYIVPLEWHFSDLPLEVIPEGKLGHYQPKDYNRNLYKILFTKAIFPTDSQIQGKDIIKKAYVRSPLLVVSVNRATGKVMGIDNPPTHVRWGNIPTPLF